MLELLYTSTKTIAPEPEPSHLCYLSSWDAMLLYSYNKLDKLFRDGTQVSLGVTTASSYITMGNRAGGRHFYCSWNLAVIYAADEITGQPHYADILNPAWKPNFIYTSAGGYVDDSAGILLRSASAGKIEIFRLSDGTKLGEILDPGGPLYDNLAYAGDGKVAAFHHASGKLALMDYVNRTVLFKSKVAPCLCSAYDCLHNLAITVQSDKKVRVYSMIPIPALLSAPTFNPVPAQVNRLAGHPLRTRLTGDTNEPCSGYRIDWSLASPAKGYLDKTSSQTDADGYAENFYFGKSLGAETVQVEVVA